MKKIIILTITICIILTLIFACNAQEVLTEDELESKIGILEDRQKNAHAMAEAARNLGYYEENLIIVTAKKEWQEAQEQLIIYRKELNKIIEKREAEWNKRKEEYPEATIIWLYLKDLGYNDKVCAGILGNIMAEVGGQTLKINPTIFGNGYYGICQWSEYYSKDNRIKGTLLEQLDYLRDDIKYEFDTFGYLYKKDFNYEKFLQLTDEKEAAYAFACCYERCAKQYRNLRKKNASNALAYFS